MSDDVIRSAQDADVPAMLAIYTPIVTDTVTSFEFAPPSLEEFRTRVQAAHLWLVTTDAAGAVLGFAYGGTHRSRAAYQWSVETSIYLEPAAQGQGRGRRLYQELLDQLLARGFRNAYAGIARPNDASEAFHRALGFAPIGVFKAVGFKFGHYCDVSWWHRVLSPDPPDVAD